MLIFLSCLHSRAKIAIFADFLNELLHFINRPFLAHSATPSLTVGGGGMSISQDPDDGQFPSSTSMPTDVPAPSDNVTSGGGGSDVGLIVAVVVGAVLLALAVVGVIVLVIVLVRGKKGGNKESTYDVPQACTNAGLENPVYSGL